MGLILEAGAMVFSGVLLFLLSLKHINRVFTRSYGFLLLTMVPAPILKAMAFLLPEYSTVLAKVFLMYTLAGFTLFLAVMGELAGEDRVVRLAPVFSVLMVAGFYEVFTSEVDPLFTVLPLRNTVMTIILFLLSYIYFGLEREYRKAYDEFGLPFLRKDRKYIVVALATTLLTALLFLMFLVEGFIEVIPRETVSRIVVPFSFLLISLSMLLSTAFLSDFGVILLSGIDTIYIRVGVYTALRMGKRKWEKVAEWIASEEKLKSITAVSKTKTIHYWHGEIGGTEVLMIVVAGRPNRTTLSFFLQFLKNFRERLQNDRVLQKKIREKPVEVEGRLREAVMEELRYTLLTFY